MVEASRDAFREVTSAFSSSNDLFKQANKHMNLRQIAEGWRSLFQPSDEISQLAAARLAVCETCNEKRENSPLVNGLIRGTVPDDKAIYAYSCGLCKCFLAAKAHAADSTCPLGKWKGGAA